MKLVVFDLDGTLIDSRRDLAESANALLTACGGQALSEEAVGRLVGDGAAALVSRAFAAAKIAQPPDALERFLRIYDSRLLQWTRPYPGVSDALEDLSTRTTLGVLTNKSIGPTREILAGLNLARFFRAEYVRGGDGPHPRKPDPAGLRQLAADAGAHTTDTLLVGDSVVDWRTARAAGTGVCLVRYGFGFADFPVEELGPGDTPIDYPSELAPRIQDWARQDRHAAG